MNKAILVVVFASVGLSFCGDRPEYRPIQRQQVMQVLIAQAALGGHQIVIENEQKNNIPYSKKYRSKSQRIVPKCQKFPKQRMNAIGQPRRGY